jgi:hypothetical protein
MPVNGTTLPLLKRLDCQGSCNSLLSVWDMNFQAICYCADGHTLDSLRLQRTHHTVAAPNEWPTPCALLTRLQCCADCEILHATYHIIVAYSGTAVVQRRPVGGVPPGPAKTPPFALFRAGYGSLRTGQIVSAFGGQASGGRRRLQE